MKSFKFTVFVNVESMLSFEYMQSLESIQPVGFMHFLESASKTEAVETKEGREAGKVMQAIDKHFLTGEHR
jgi:hypothetical protein